MEIQVPYGRSTMSADVADHLEVDIIEPGAATAAMNPFAEVERALAEPIGGFDWDRWEQARSVAIAVNDKTRPVPHRYLLPPLTERLTRLGIEDAAVTFHVAVGGHHPMSPDEFADVLPPEILGRYRVVSHDAASRTDLVRVGDTTRGTPVWVNRGYHGADLKIVVGTIEPHQFVGFSGGVKSAAIGLAGLDTINANHTLMAHPDAQIGTYETNPARQDVEEIGRLIGVDLALNVVVDQQRRIVKALAGEPVAVMIEGAPLAGHLGLVSVGQDYPVVITSPGGHPKDINVYQAQKAVGSAARIVRPGGTIVLVAACPEGAGSEDYERWVAPKRSRRDVIESFQAEGFRIGPHKAFQLARDTEKARLLVCSEMPDELADRLLLDPAPSLQTALDRMVPVFGAGDRVAVLPHANSTIPSLERGS